MSIKKIDNHFEARKSTLNQMIVISATFTIEAIDGYVTYLLNRLNISVDIEIAPYHQVFQQLLDPASAVGRNQDGINIFFIRIEDFVRDVEDASARKVKAKQASDELKQAFEQFASQRKAPAVVFLLSASPRCNESERDYLDELTQQLHEYLAGLNGLVMVNNDALCGNRTWSATYYDEISDELAHVPLSEDGYANLALSTVRQIHMLKTTAKKVLVLDCDNTIWKGVVGEDGVDGLTLSQGYLALQQYAVDIQSQGVLICIASKNAEQDVLDVFNKRQDMVLKAEHVVTHRINWLPKYQSLESMAAELNLGLDAFVFIDDNPVECGQMREALPQVLTFQIPEESEVENWLSKIWVFDKLSVTEEDARRTQMYKENSARSHLESTVTDIGAFLASLELQISVVVPDEADWARLSQLTQRTNQFNFTTVRRGEAELRALVKQSGYHVFKVTVKDRFGDYGLVGELIVTKNGERLIVDTFLLSCRVLGRGVEHAMLRGLAQFAIEQKCEVVELPYSRTAKNEPARAFAEHVIGKYRLGDPDNAIYSVPASDLINVMYEPGNDPEAIKEAKRGETKKKPQTTQSLKASTQDGYIFLTQMANSSDLVAHVKGAKARTRDLETPAVLPQHDREIMMVDLWQSVIGVQGIGMDDDFSALGGTSLMAARLFADIANVFKVRLRLTKILEANTPRKLLEEISSHGKAQANALVELRKGSKEHFFLIHDGDGETLLYVNLANRLPSGISVTGIEPRSLPNIPLAHTSIDDMANYYVELIKQKQSVGPYYLGGMCAGGLLAYAVAEKLLQAGDKVGFVVALDAAMPNARRKFGHAAKARMGRVKQLSEEAKRLSPSLINQMCYVVTGVTKKTLNALSWFYASRTKRVSTFIRFNMLRRSINAGTAWPSWLKPLTVREIYNSAERQYVPPQSDITTYLIRATSGQDDDVAFRELYEAHDFGWSNYVSNVIVIDTPGGHASMLQEPNVAELSKHLTTLFEKTVS